MKFGKLKDIEGVDFALPGDAPGTGESLQWGTSSCGKLQFYIGCTGWSMKEWVGKVYPRGTKSRDFLHHYTLQFNTIELNTTHYRIPTVDTVRRWRQEAAHDFRFCPKVPQSISHSRDLGLDGTQTALFCDHILMLEEKLGCCFIQLPPHFGYDRLELLERFVRQWPSQLPLAVELRHESWFNNRDHRQKAFDMLAGYGISAVITDVAGRRDVLHMRATTPTTMIRFVGNGLHPSDYSRIDAWIKRLQLWQQQGLKAVYFFTHEPDNLLAPDLAKYLNDQLLTFEKIESRGPTFYDEAQGEQMSLF